MPNIIAKCTHCKNKVYEDLYSSHIGGYWWCLSCMGNFFLAMDDKYGSDKVDKWDDKDLEEELLDWADIVEKLDSLGWFRKIMRDIPGGY
ncbi:hypothetical protein KAR91_50345 [Candidatus Pacearchaeota archaeon]|nr:hypothetical protein [Candidatus Pacearchaeota archaeon]